MISGFIKTRGLADVRGNGQKGLDAPYRLQAGKAGDGGTSEISGISTGGEGGKGVSEWNSSETNGGEATDHAWSASFGGHAGGTGGSGAGGGILLKGYDIDITGGTIDTRGGNNNDNNAGTLKIFYGNTYTSGEIYKEPYVEKNKCQIL